MEQRKFANEPRTCAFYREPRHLSVGVVVAVAVAFAVTVCHVAAVSLSRRAPSLLSLPAPFLTPPVLTQVPTDVAKRRETAAQPRISRHALQVLAHHPV